MNADGAEWIKNLSDADTVFQLDPFHRNKAIRDYVPYKEAIQEIHELLDEKDIAGLFEYLETYKNSLSDDAEIEKAEKLITYFANNRQGLLSYQMTGNLIARVSKGVNISKYGDDGESYLEYNSQTNEA